MHRSLGRCRYLLWWIVGVRNVLVVLRRWRMVGICAVIVVLMVRRLEVVRRLAVRILRHGLHLRVRERHEMAGCLVLVVAHIRHRVAVSNSISILLLLLLLMLLLLMLLLLLLLLMLLMLLLLLLLGMLLGKLLLLWMVAMLLRDLLVVVAVIGLAVRLLTPIVHRDICDWGFHPVVPPPSTNNGHLV